MRKVLWMLFGLLSVALLYYLFIRPFEFEVRFKTSTSPGDLIETIRIWNRSLDNSKIVEVDSFKVLSQTIVRENRRYVYNWFFTAENDSVTKVNVQIMEPGRNVINKLLIPFTDQPIESDASDITTEFYTVLKEHLKITSVKLIGEVELDSSFCACTYLETFQIEKASGMMRDYPLLTSFVAKFDLKIDGPPSVRVREWNHSVGHLKFDFCFPIVPSDSLPLADEIIYKKFGKVKALKAEYYGNYITSDRAWYELLQYAEKNGYRVNGLPIEYFHNNPTLGVNEREWKADVYLPIK